MSTVVQRSGWLMAKALRTRGHAAGSVTGPPFATALPGSVCNIESLMAAALACVLGRWHNPFALLHNRLCNTTHERAVTSGRRTGQVRTRGGRMASKDPRRPNVLFIVSDDQGAWALGCGGNHEMRTPV